MATGIVEFVEEFRSWPYEVRMACLWDMENAAEDDEGEEPQGKEGKKKSISARRKMTKDIFPRTGMAFTDEEDMAILEAAERAKLFETTQAEEFRKIAAKLGRTPDALATRYWTLEKAGKQQ